MIEIKNTLFVGKVLHQYKTLDSTNDFAKELLSKSKPPEGTAISTCNQTHGRGQIGSSWQSEPDKNITCSIILYPKFLKPLDQFFLSQITALAVYSTISKLINGNVQIKWPNDILVSNKKVAGILIQNALSGNRINESIIGIGLNVNQIHFSGFDTQPTSLRLESNKVFDLTHLLGLLFCELEKWYLDLKNGRIEAIQDHYYQHLYGYGKLLRFCDVSGRSFEGKIIGLTKEGFLSVEEAGQITNYGLKEIKFLKI